MDESEWEHEEFRRKGLSVLQIFRDRRAVWDNRTLFEAELAEARRENIGERFEAANELDPAFCATLDRDLRARWRRAGYEVPSLRCDMRALFSELERDAADRASSAREGLLGDVLKAQAQEMQ